MTDVQKRIAIGGLHTECSSYSPLQQTAADFTRTTGRALCDIVAFDFAKHAIEPVPIFYDRSVPGGPVAPDTFAAQCSAFIAKLHTAMPLDGVLLLMHGAMFVPGVDDPEGAFIRQIRDVVGPEAIISASFDLHGQITAAICDTLDAFAAYRTAPHIDVAATHRRAAQLLIDALHNNVRPCICWEPIPILVPGEMSSTFVSPCDQLFAQLAGLDETPSICDSNLMIGYVWADSPRATAAAVVTATDREAGQRVAQRIAQSYRNIREALCFDMEACDLDTALDRVSGQTAVLADSGDNPTAGGVGDRADVLFALQQLRIEGALLAGIASPSAFDALCNGADHLTLGNALGGGGPEVTLAVQTCQFFGNDAVVQSEGLTVIVTKKRRPFQDFSDFASLELTLDDYPLLVVKSGYLSPDIRTLPRRQIMALTDGAVCQNLERLDNDHRPTGTWPFSKWAG